MVSCGVGHRRGSDLALLWLWLWLWLAAVALIRPLAWEHPYAMDVTLKKKERKKERETLPGCSNCVSFVYLVSSHPWANQFSAEYLRGVFL